MLQLLNIEIGKAANWLGWDSNQRRLQQRLDWQSQNALLKQRAVACTEGTMTARKGSQLGNNISVCLLQEKCQGFCTSKERESGDIPALHRHCQDLSHSQCHFLIHLSCIRLHHPDHRIIHLFNLFRCSTINIVIIVSRGGSGGRVFPYYSIISPILFSSFLPSSSSSLFLLSQLT